MIPMSPVCTAGVWGNPQINTLRVGVWVENADLFALLTG